MTIMLTLICVAETARVHYRPAATPINPAHDIFDGNGLQPTETHAKGVCSSSVMPCGRR